METVELTQDELKILVNILNSVTVKLADARLIDPLEKKLTSKIHVEKKKDEVTIKQN